MNKYFFISNKTLKKLSLALFCLWFFGFYKLLLILVILIVLYLLLYRKRFTDLHERKFLSRDILIAPISSFVNRVSENHILFCSSFYHGFGVYFPTIAEVENIDRIEEEKEIFNILKLKRTRTEIILKTKQELRIKMVLENSFMMPKGEVFIDIGDKATVGALMGYLPFGSKVAIELNNKIKISVKEKDYVSSTQTVIAHIKED